MFLVKGNFDCTAIKALLVLQLLFTLPTAYMVWLSCLHLLAMRDKADGTVQIHAVHLIKRKLLFTSRKAANHRFRAKAARDILGA